MKYYIAATYPHRPVKAGDPVPANPIEIGHSKTPEKAITRARRATKGIRTDCAVYVHDGQRVIAASGINSGPGGVFQRDLA